MKRVVAGIGLALTAAIASVVLAISSSAAAPANPASAATTVMLPSKPIILAQADAAAPAAPAATPDAAAAPAAAPGAAAAPAGGVDQFGLPLGPGHDLTVSKCGGCHDVTEFSGQRHSADDWGGVVGDMIGRGADINDADFKTISEYLATSLPKAP